VTDASGAVIPGAKISLTNKETNNTRSVVSSEDGVYSIPQLPPGRYMLSVERDGFKKKLFEDFVVTADQIQGANVQLEPGAVSQEVTVSADETPLINTENASINTTITAQDVQKLPSFGRDVFQLTQLAPGVFGDASREGSGNSNSQPGNAGPGASGASSGVFSTENRPQVSANGGRTDANNITLDGIGITSVSWGGAAVVTPNEDSVKEVRVLSNNYDAENGRFSGAQIQVISQNGTNNYHGSLFFKVDRPGLNSFQPWSGSNDQPRNPERNTSRFNDWGGSIGGPIIKNKLFAFFSYERIANAATATAQGWFETPQLLASAPAGSIAAQYGAYPGEAAVGSVLDQSCSAAGLIEGTNCHAIAGQGLDIGRPLNPALFPLGTKDPSFQSATTPGLGGDGSGSLTNLDSVADIMYINAVGPNNGTNVQYNGRLDFQATSRDLIAFSIYKVPVSTLSYNTFRAANLFHHDATNEAETALWDHTFSPTLINELRVNAAGWRWNELASNPQIPLGLPQPLFIGDEATDGGKIGSIKPSDNPLGGPAGSIFNQWTYGLKDVLTKVHGSHNLKFGAEVTKLTFVQDAPWSARPQFGFNNYWDFLNDAPVKESGTFNPLNGEPTDVRKDSRSTILGFFAQDDWKLRSNLTINLGLRWEYFGPISFQHGALSTLVLGSGANTLTDMHMRLGGNLYNADKHNIGPQIGFAWSPRSVAGHDLGSKLVVRGGFGIGYNGEQEAITLNGWPNVPFTNGNTNFTGSQIVYAIPSDPHQFLPYPANPNAVLTFGSNNLPATGTPVSVTGFPANYPTPYSYRYSLTTEYEVGRNWVASLAYQGSKSRHLTRQENLNQVLGAQGIALNPMVYNVDYYAQDANATFNAFLAEAKHRFSSSFQLDFQYRYAKSADDASGPYEVSYYQWDPKANWGPSAYDATHLFKAWGIWSPRLGGNGWVEKVLGGWTLSSIMNFHTGYPFSPVYFESCDVVFNHASCDNGGQSALLPAAYLGGATHSYSNATFLSKGGNFPNGGATYFTEPTVPPCAATFPATCTAIPQAPGTERNAFRGPRYFDVDATLAKRFGLPKLPLLGEGAGLEFRINAYNLLNSLNLKDVVNNINDPHFGQATTALGARTVEMQARFNF
jgi:Carboxypeptidase regulatory-like domain/TonB dependent receptor